MTDFVAENADIGTKLLSFDVASEEAQFMLMWISMGFTIIFYGLLCALGLHNFFKYIVKQ